MTLTTGPEMRELTPIVLVSHEILEGLATKGPSYQSAISSVRAANLGEEHNPSV